MICILKREHHSVTEVVSEGMDVCVLHDGGRLLLRMEKLPPSACVSRVLAGPHGIYVDEAYRESKPALTVWTAPTEDAVTYRYKETQVKEVDETWFAS